MGSEMCIRDRGTMADIDTYQIHPTWVYPDIGTLYRKLEETV